MERTIEIDLAWPDKEYVMLVDSKGITQRTPPKERAWSCSKTLDQGEVFASSGVEATLGSNPNLGRHVLKDKF